MAESAGPHKLQPNLDSGCDLLLSSWGAQIREMRMGMLGDSVLWGDWWLTRCSTTVCLDMCFIR